MRRLLINTQKFLIGNAIGEAVRREESDFEVMNSESTEEILDINSWFIPNIVLLEVPNCTPYRLKDRLKIVEDIRNMNRNCNVVVIVNENLDKDVANCVRKIQKSGLIDDFIYSSISTAYLVAIVDSLA